MEEVNNYVERHIKLGKGKSLRIKRQVPKVSCRAECREQNLRDYIGREELNLIRMELEDAMDILRHEDPKMYEKALALEELIL